jgi:hypothetical protein
MRKLVIALTAAAGFALLPSTGAVAAPFGGVALDTAATAASTTIDVGYRRRHGGWHCPPRTCWRWVCKRVYKRFR